MKGSGKLASFLWWSYPRGSLEYDIMVGIILAFIFLTPRSFFRDQPRADEAAGPAAAHLTERFTSPHLGRALTGAEPQSATPAPRMWHGDVGALPRAGQPGGPPGEVSWSAGCDPLPTRLDAVAARIALAAGRQT